VPHFTGFGSLALALLLLGAAPPAVVGAESRGVVPSKSSKSYIVVGFVGGFVRHTNPHHGPVLLAQKLQESAPADAHIEVFENRHRRSARKTIIRLLDADHDGLLSNEEKAAAHIMLFGQSWGASAVVMLARELDRLGIPVMLTVQVDSVAKPGENDGVIPENVAAAVNFYQIHGFVHGRPLIRAADESKTRILGNYRFDYKQTPVQCQGYSWLDRVFTPGHMQSECDPHIWSQVETLVRERMKPDPASLAASPLPGN